MTDAPLARALRVVEKLIAQRLRQHQERAAQPDLPRNAQRSLHQRADELGVLIGEIRAARQASEDAGRSGS